MDIKSIQDALKAAGFDPGEADGVWGRRTIAAVKSFQQARGLEADGIVGPQTAAALGGAPAGAPPAVADATNTPLVWYQEALRLVGTKEQPGAGSNPELIHWAQALNIDYKSDDIAWCGLFVGHCIGSTLPEERLPSGVLGARNWASFGKRCDPVEGAVLVFWRDDPNGPFGHVGFYRGEDADAYHVLGGNQSDQVNTTRVGRNRLLEARWPHTAASLRGAKVQAAGKGPLSHNEA